MDEIGPFSTAAEMLAALRAREVSSVELVDMHVDRIERLDGALADMLDRFVNGVGGKDQIDI